MNFAIRVTLLLCPLLAVSECAGAMAWDPSIVALGRDRSRGCLVEYYPGVRGGPVVVITHGFNPFPRVVRFSFMQSYANCIHARCGPHVRILGWDWNRATLAGLRTCRNQLNCRGQGECLARALLQEGINPARTHLIGHSMGSIVVSSAARCLANQRCPVQRVTLLDPVWIYHPMIFDCLDVTSAACTVDHYWTPRPTGLGADSCRPDVADYCVRRRNTIGGRVNLLRSNHVYVLPWYLDTIRNPRGNCGFRCPR